MKAIQHKTLYVLPHLLFFLNIIFKVPAQNLPAARNDCPCTPINNMDACTEKLIPCAYTIRFYSFKYLEGPLDARFGFDITSDETVAHTFDYTIYKVDPGVEIIVDDYFFFNARVECSTKSVLTLQVRGFEESDEDDLPRSEEVGKTAFLIPLSCPFPLFKTSYEKVLTLSRSGSPNTFKVSVKVKVMASNPTCGVDKGSCKAVALPPDYDGTPYGCTYQVDGLVLQNVMSPNNNKWGEFDVTMKSISSPTNGKKQSSLIVEKGSSVPFNADRLAEISIDCCDSDYIDINFDVTEKSNDAKGSVKGETILECPPTQNYFGKAFNQQLSLFNSNNAETHIIDVSVGTTLKNVNNCLIPPPPAKEFPCTFAFVLKEVRHMKSPSNDKFGEFVFHLAVSDMIPYKTKIIEIDNREGVLVDEEFAKLTIPCSEKRRVEFSMTAMEIDGFYEIDEAFLWREFSLECGKTRNLVERTYTMEFKNTYNIPTHTIKVVIAQRQESSTACSCVAETANTCDLDISFYSIQYIEGWNVPDPIGMMFDFKLNGKKVFPIDYGRRSVKIPDINVGTTSGIDVVLRDKKERNLLGTGHETFVRIPKTGSKTLIVSTKGKTMNKKKGNKGVATGSLEMDCSFEYKDLDLSMVMKKKNKKKNSVIIKLRVTKIRG